VKGAPIFVFDPRGTREEAILIYCETVWCKLQKFGTDSLAMSDLNITDEQFMCEIRIHMCNYVVIMLLSYIFKKNDSPPMATLRSRNM
jgi:hypothetical protein